MRPLRIGITRGRNFHFYENWMVAIQGVEVVPLTAENTGSASSCDGIIFSGGEDIHPSHYGHPDYVAAYHLTDFNPDRDRFELDLAGEILDSGVPVLGICRGMQLLNVHFGGTLVPDLPSFGKPPHSRDENGTDRRHAVTIEPDSRLAHLAGTSGTINSAHHQAVDKVAPGFRVVAISTDGVIESIERTSASDNYLLLVQWHPERMQDTDNLLSKSIRTDFLDAVRKHAAHQH